MGAATYISVDGVNALDCWSSVDGDTEQAYICEYQGKMILNLSKYSNNYGYFPDICHYNGQLSSTDGEYFHISEQTFGNDSSALNYCWSLGFIPVSTNSYFDELATLGNGNQNVFKSIRVIINWTFICKAMTDMIIYGS